MNEHECLCQTVRNLAPFIPMLSDVEIVRACRAAVPQTTDDAIEAAIREVAGELEGRIMPPASGGVH